MLTFVDNIISCEIKWSIQSEYGVLENRLSYSPASLTILSIVLNTEAWYMLTDELFDYN